jgi:hypothetical protein
MAGAIKESSNLEQTRPRKAVNAPFIHSFIQQIFIKILLCDRLCAVLGYREEESNTLHF